MAAKKTSTNTVRQFVKRGKRKTMIRGKTMRKYRR